MKTNPETGAILASEMLKGIARLEASNGPAVAAFEADLKAVDRMLLKPRKPKGKRDAKAQP